MLLRLRVVLALLFAVLFYAVAVGSAAGLGWLGVHLGLSVTHFRGRGVILLVVVALALLGAGLVVLWSLVPRRQRFVAPGPELSPATHPRLFREVEHIAALTGERPPAHVYLVPEVNAFVTERGGVLGLGSTRVMGVGLPLLANLTVAQLRSVLAHEFGHFAGGDVKLLPWINKARAAMIGSVQNLSSAAEAVTEGELAAAGMVFAVVRAPFLWGAKLYLRFTQALSRAQEIAADTLAVRVAGTRTHVEALSLTNRAGLAFGAFMNQEVQPLLSEGRVPPLARGFSAFLSAANVRRALDAAPSPVSADPYDSHPPLEVRIAHAERLALPGPRRPDDDEPALSLLSDVGACELEVLRFVTECPELQPVAWEDSGKHLSASWRREHASMRGAFRSRTLAEAPRTPEAVRSLLSENDFSGSDASDAVLLGFARRLTWLTCALALVDRGYRVINRPGEAIRFAHGEERCDPMAEIDRFHSADGSVDAWRAQWAQVGIADVPFSVAPDASPA
jgi:heat shock protein HtpX